MQLLKNKIIPSSNGTFTQFLIKSFLKDTSTLTYFVFRYFSFAEQVFTLPWPT